MTIQKHHEDFKPSEPRRDLLQANGQQRYNNWYNMRIWSCPARAENQKRPIRPMLFSGHRKFPGIGYDLSEEFFHSKQEENVTLRWTRSCLSSDGCSFFGHEKGF